MKKHFSFALFFLFSVVYCNRSVAQLSGDCVFLPGHWVEIGIAPNGSLGSTVGAVPAGVIILILHPWITMIPGQQHTPLLLQG